MLSEPVLALAERLVGTLARAAAPVDVPLDGRRGDRGGAAHGQALHRRLRGRGADAQLARHDGRGRRRHLRGGAQRLRPGRAGSLRAARAVRLPLPDPPLRRRLRLAPCLEAGFDLFDQTSVGSPAAVVAEPVLSAGGMIVPPPGYFLRLRRAARERGMLLVLDDARPGSAGSARCTARGLRRGARLLVLSKTLGGGVPISAVVTSARDRGGRARAGLMHVTSHVSDPMPAAAALAVIDVVEEEGLAARLRSRGEYLLARLRELGRAPAHRRRARPGPALRPRAGRGPRDQAARRRAGQRADRRVLQRCGLSMNLVRGGTGGAASCLRMAPPLTVAEEEIDLAVTGSSTRR